MIMKLMKLELEKKRDMEPVMSSFMGSFLLWAIFVFDLLLKVSGNAEGDALNALKNNMVDPNNFLQNWDPMEINPCMWFRVKCNSDNSVIRLDLGDVNLSGELVPQLGQLRNLQYLELYSNNISGKIPNELGKLINLVSLDLYVNGLTGPIPDTLGNLKKLRFLRLNNNGLSGKIPKSLTTIASLIVLDLSNNQLEGDIPVDGLFPLIPTISFRNNPGLKQQKFSPPPPISPTPPVPSGNISTVAVVGGVASGVALLFASFVIALAYWQRKKPQDHYFDVLAKEDPYDIHRSQLTQFSLFELQVATNNFSKDNILCKGVSWKVYKGHLADGSLVAVKRFKKKHTEGQKRQFETEVKMISMAVHRNLLRLRGFCITLTERLLVYPFMVNRSLAWYLRERPESQPPLSWTTRKCVALGAARGLAYLHDHCDQKIIHRDVNPTNILLDEKFEAVIADFGLSKLMDYNGTNVTTSVCGTIGYIAPEYLSTGKTSEKTDVFGYGVMLLELITGQTAHDLARLANDDDAMLLDWLCIQFTKNMSLVKGVRRYKRLGTLVDIDLQGNYDEEEVEQLTQLALLCTQGSPMGRPKMSDVVRMLEGDGLADRWEQYCQREETLEYDFNNIHHPTSDWIVDSTSSFQPEEVSERNTVAGRGIVGVAMLSAALAALYYASPVILCAFWKRKKPQDHSGDFHGTTVARDFMLGFGLLSIATSGTIMLLAAFANALAYMRRKKPQDRYFDVPAEEDSHVHLGQLKQFSLGELQIATDNFNIKNIVGRGGFGKVYKGCLADGSQVAVKRLKEERTKREELQFQIEVEIISLAVHPNLLQLRGFCMTPTERLLVYPFMANRSVAWHLRERPQSQPPLDWPTRKRIALGAAKGLAYLHDHCHIKIIHRDVKVANILLNEEFEAVVGDFGLAKLMDYKDTHVTTAVRGTIGHIAPEYLLTKKISEKTDVFGYGVMLLELITRQRAFDLTRLANDDDAMLFDWVKGLLKDKRLETVVDADLQGNYNEEGVEQLIQLALLCTEDSPLERPKMTEVAIMLQGVGLAEKWEQYCQKEETRGHDFNNIHHPNSSVQPWDPFIPW